MPINDTSSQPGPEPDSSAEYTTLVCLPAGASTDRARLSILIATRLLPHLADPALRLCSRHLTVTPESRTGQPPLLGSRIGPDGLTYCVGAPLGLLDFAGSAPFIARVARQLHQRWVRIVADTPTATPWRPFFERLGTEDGYRPEQAVDDFFAQPRLEAVTGAMLEGDYPLSIDEYGPALQAHQQDPDTFAEYLSGTVQYGDALVTLDGRLLVAGGRPRPSIEHTLAELSAHHDQVRDYLAGLDPRTVVVTAHCHL